MRQDSIRLSAPTRVYLRNVCVWENLRFGGATLAQPYRSQLLDPLGLVAGICDERSIREVLDQAPQPDPALRMVTVGTAVKAMVRNGLGCVNPPLDVVPMFFQHKPLHRLMAPSIDATHLHADPLGRALDPLDAAGVPEL